jgi:hypothetical protein
VPGTISEFRYRILKDENPVRNVPGIVDAMGAMTAPVDAARLGAVSVDAGNIGATVFALI